MSVIQVYFDDELPQMLDIIFGGLNKYTDSEQNNKFEKTDNSIFISHQYNTTVSYDMEGVTDIVECKFTISDDKRILMNTRVLLEGIHVMESVNSYDATDRGNIKHIYNTIMDMRLKNIKKLYPSFKW